MPPTGPRSVFVYLLNFLALYLSALGAAMLVWGLADHWFADPLDGYVSNGPIRSGIAMLVVAFPLFLCLNGYIRRNVEAGEAADRSLVKRVLTYVTLFVIAVTSIIDLISVIYTFLGGDLTARFAVRGLGILMIAGFVFLYYLGDLREPRPGTNGRPAPAYGTPAAPPDRAPEEPAAAGGAPGEAAAPAGNDG